MMHDRDRVIDLEQIKKARRAKKRCLIAIIVVTASIALLLVGWVIVSQILEAIEPSNFWSNFSTSSS